MSYIDEDEPLKPKKHSIIKRKLALLNYSQRMFTRRYGPIPEDGEHVWPDAAIRLMEDRYWDWAVSAYPEDFAPDEDWAQE